MTPRLKEKYLTEVVPALMQEFNYGSVMQVPRMNKVVVNIGLGEAALIRFARLDELQKAWKATPAGQAPDKELEPFLRLQEIFQEVHRRHNLALGPKHPDTLKVLDFIQKSLS